MEVSDTYKYARGYYSRKFHYLVARRRDFASFGVPSPAVTYTGSLCAVVGFPEFCPYKTIQVRPLTTPALILVGRLDMLS